MLPRYAPNPSSEAFSIIGGYPLFNGLVKRRKRSSASNSRQLSRPVIQAHDVVEHRMRNPKFQEAIVEQHALSVITRIKPAEFDHLGSVLDQIGNPETNTLIDFHAITSLHFCCWVIVADDSRFSPCLVLESNYDGALEQHLDQLIAHAGVGLDAIYRACEGYPAEGIAAPQKVRDYLLGNAVP